MTRALLFADPFVVCFRGSHLPVGVLACATVALYVVGLPALTFRWLLQAPRGALAPPRRRSSTSVSPSLASPSEPVPASSPGGAEDPLLGPFIKDSGYTPLAWYWRHVDMSVVLGLSALAALLPLPGTLGLLAAKVSLTLALLAALLCCLVALPNPYKEPWRRPVRVAIVVLSASCVVVNAASRALDLGAGGATLSAFIAPASYVNVALFCCTIAVMLVLLIRSLPASSGAAGVQSPKSDVESDAAVGFYALAVRLQAGGTADVEAVGTDATWAYAEVTSGGADAKSDTIPLSSPLTQGHTGSEDVTLAPSRVAELNLAAGQSGLRESHPRRLLAAADGIHFRRPLDDAPPGPAIPSGPVATLGPLAETFSLQPQRPPEIRRAAGGFMSSDMAPFAPVRADDRFLSGALPAESPPQLQPMWSHAASPSGISTVAGAPPAAAPRALRRGSFAGVPEPGRLGAAGPVGGGRVVARRASFAHVGASLTASTFDGAASFPAAPPVARGGSLAPFTLPRRDGALSGVHAAAATSLFGPLPGSPMYGWGPQQQQQPQPSPAGAPLSRASSTLQRRGSAAAFQVGASGLSPPMEVTAPASQGVPLGRRFSRHASAAHAFMVMQP